jgi:hypothetical protein
VVPDTTQGKDTYRIAANNERSFSRAFLKATRELLTPEVLEEMLDAIDRQSATGVIAALPRGDEEDDAFNRSMFNAYEKVIQESGSSEFKNLNRQLGTDLVFRIEKQELPVIPMNTYSIQWIRRRLATFRLQSITEPQTQVIMEILGDGFERGLRPELILNEIKENIGLTAREYTAVQTRRLLHEVAGLSEQQTTKLTNKYRDELLSQRAQRIARTETIAAQASGRHTAWQLADEAGSLPEVVRVWDSAPETANPNRPCQICLELDGQETGLNEPYQSSFVGDVEGPPVHPS